MTELERRIKAKIPGEDTGIVVKHSVCDVCAPGPHCGVDCYVKDGKIIKVEGTDSHPTNHGLLCPKGQSNRQYVYRPDRIHTPLRRVGARGEGKFEPISWDEALDEVARHMLEYKEQFGPESVAFFSGYEKWYRPYLERLTYAFGSPNYGTESSCCFTSAVMAWRIAAGVDKCDPDLRHCKLFLGWAYGGYYNAYLSARPTITAHENGMKVIIIDHRRTPMAERIADLFIQIRPGTDAALAFCFANELIRRGWIDHDYIEKNVHGFKEYAEYVSKFTPEYTETITGVSPALIEQAVQMMHENMPVAINESGSGMLHHRNGMQGYRAIMALSALMGTFDRPGGQIPTFLTYAHSMGGFETKEYEFSTEIRPHIEAVGARTFPVWEETVHEMQSMDLPRQILDADPYPIKMVWAHGMNYRMFSDDERMKRALESLDFFVDIDLFLTDTAKLADIVLPCCSGFERSELRIHGGAHATYTQKVIEPLYQSRSDTDIIFDLAKRLNLDDPYITSDYDTCLRYMLRDNPEIDLDELKSAGGLPVHVNAKMYEVGTWQFRTPSGKFELWSERIAKYADQGFTPLPTMDDPLPGDAEKYPFTMISGTRRPNMLHSRLHDMPWLQSLGTAITAEINTFDAERLGIKDGDWVELYTDLGSIEMKAKLTAFTMAGTINTYHSFRDADVNKLIPADACDRYSGFPAFKSYRCGLRKKVTE